MSGYGKDFAAGLLLSGGGTVGGHEHPSRMERRRRRTFTFALPFVVFLGYLYTRFSSVSSQKTTSLPPNHTSVRTRCANLKLKPSPPQIFPERTVSERYVPGTRPVLIRNATIWTGRVNGLEIIKGDLVLEKCLVKSAGVVPKAAMKSLEKDDFDFVDAKGAWVTPGLIGLHADGKFEYAGLDELIVSHIHAMARCVEDLMNHEKFKKDDDELQKFMVKFVSANPSKSIYGFTLNRKRPGHFNLSFLAKKGSSIQTWPVRVTPEAYIPFDTQEVGIPELCDAFKVCHLHESHGLAGAPGCKTPYSAGRMTPAHTPGYATPGRMSIRHTHPNTRTPNPCAGPTPNHQPPPPPPPMGMPPPPGVYGHLSNYGATPTPTAPVYRYQAPSAGMGTPGGAYGQPQPPPPPVGMNPARAAMIQNSSAWAPGGGGRW